MTYLVVLLFLLLGVLANIAFIKQFKKILEYSRHCLIIDHWDLISLVLFFVSSVGCFMVGFSILLSR